MKTFNIIGKILLVVGILFLALNVIVNLGEPKIAIGWLVALSWSLTALFIDISSEGIIKSYRSIVNDQQSLMSEMLETMQEQAQKIKELEETKISVKVEDKASPEIKKAIKKLKNTTRASKVKVDII